jgi:DNA helicase-2/ATP-dependent DNA helicase PcrA
MRVINYPARGIGNTTIENYGCRKSLQAFYEVMQNIDKIDLKLNSGTKQKIILLL